jgi:hypothetical protein
MRSKRFPQRLVWRDLYRLQLLTDFDSTQSAAEYRKSAIDTLKSAVKAASKILGPTSSDSAERPEKAAKKSEDKDAPASSPAKSTLEFNTERKKEIIKALISMTRRAKNLVGDGWDAVKGGLGLNAVADAVKVGNEGLKVQVAQLLAV